MHAVHIPMDIYALTTQYCPIDVLIMCYLPDIHNYSTNLDIFKKSLSILWAETFKINGGSSGHILFYWPSSFSNIMEYSILLNSLIFGFLTSRISFVLKKLVYINCLFYLMIVPFAIFYSIGPTKEPLIFFVLSILFLPIFKNVNKFTYAILFLCRPYLFFIILYIKLFKNYILDFLILVFVIFSLPAIQSHIYDFKALAAPAVKLSRVIDNLRFESYIFGFLGFVTFGLKVFFEPAIYFFKSGLVGLGNILMDINLIILLIFIRNIFVIEITSFFTQNKNLIRFLALNALVTFSYPIVQFRYIALGLLVFNLQCLISTREK
ncbi:hypothetical protein MCEREM36_00860 [Candidatus Methylopumilus universalis]